MYLIQRLRRGIASKIQAVALKNRRFITDTANDGTNTGNQIYCESNLGSFRCG